MLGRFRPKKLISLSGPGPAQKAWLGLDQPGPATKLAGGIIFPHSPACRTLFVLHAGNKTKRHNEGGRRITWRGGGGASLVCRLCWWCCGGGRWRCRGSRTAAVVLLRPSSSSLLFRHCFFSLFPLLPLSTMFFSLYSGVMEVLVLLEPGGGVLAHGRRLQAAAVVLLFSVFSHDPPGLFSLSFQLFLPLTVFRSLSLSLLVFFFVLLLFLLLCFFVSSLFSARPPFLSFGSFLPFSPLSFQCSWVYL